MTLDPDEFRSLKLPRALRGYAREPVDRLLAHVAELVGQFERDRTIREAALADAERAQAEAERRAAVAAEERERLVEAVGAARRRYEELVATLQEIQREREQLAETLSSLQTALEQAGADRERLLAAIGELREEREERKAYVERVERELFTGAPQPASPDRQPSVVTQAPDQPTIRTLLASAQQALERIRRLAGS